jgi:hypothetical protein
MWGMNIMYFTHMHENRTMKPLKLFKKGGGETRKKNREGEFDESICMLMEISQ